MIEFFDGQLNPFAFSRLQNFILFTEIDSTSELARGLIDHAAQEEVPLPPTVIAALAQTKGRGRRGRPWKSPPGGLYATFVFAAPESCRLALVPLSAALWTADALHDAFGLEVSLKWPNDVLCRGRKIAGVLTEARSRGAQTHLAVGIGVNVLGDPADLGEAEATTAEREARKRPSVARLLGALCGQADDFLREPASETVVSRWMLRSAHRAGDRLMLRLEGPGGAHTVSGTFAGLNSDGFLCLETEGGRATLCAGEIEEW